MGHQFRFYQTPKDIAAMEQRLRKRTDLVIFTTTSGRASPHVVDSLNAEENGRRITSYYLALPEDMGSLVMRHVPEQGYWSFYYPDLPMIQLGTCYFDGKILRSDRMYYVDGLYGPNDQWMMKSEEFRKWAKVVFSAAKKTLRRLDPNSKFVEYIGEDAAVWHAAGGKLVRQ